MFTSKVLPVDDFESATIFEQEGPEPPLDEEDELEELEPLPPLSTT